MKFSLLPGYGFHFSGSIYCSDLLTNNLVFSPVLDAKDNHHQHISLDASWSGRQIFDLCSQQTRANVLFAPPAQVEYHSFFAEGTVSGLGCALFLWRESHTLPNAG